MKAKTLERVNGLHGRLEAAIGLTENLEPDIKATLEEAANTCAEILNSTEVAVAGASTEESEQYILSGRVRVGAVARVYAHSLQGACAAVIDGEGEIELEPGDMEGMTFEWDGVVLPPLEDRDEDEDLRIETEQVVAEVPLDDLLEREDDGL